MAKKTPKGCKARSRTSIAGNMFHYSKSIPPFSLSSWSSLSTSICIVLLFLIHPSFVCVSDAVFQPPGDTDPFYIELEVGASANLSCTIYPAVFRGRRNSSSLYFVEEDTNRRIPSSDIYVEDNTTIILMLRNVTQQDRNYVCKSGNIGIGIIHVSVGTFPLNVTDFDCKGFNFIQMECSFTIPHNRLATQYNLTYAVVTPDYVVSCPLEIKQERAICYMHEDLNNYWPQYMHYTFKLISTNQAGSNEQVFHINNFESVTPPIPAYMVENITPSSVTIAWKMERYVFYRKRRLEFDLRLRAADPDITFDWLRLNNYILSQNRSEYQITVEDLPYAYYFYELSLRIRMKRQRRHDQFEDEDDDVGWTVAVTKQFRTEPLLPFAPPLTDISSFYVGPSETTVRLYWEELPTILHNGPNFEYVVTSVKQDGVETDLKPLSIDRSSALFPWNPRFTYEFIIRSRNSMGDSLDSAQIVVPAISHRVGDAYNPRWIRNIYHANNRSYSLTWIPPLNTLFLQDYTVYWCQSKPASHTECRSSMSFDHVPKSMTRYETKPQEQEKTMIFAVAANYMEYNTGMHWTTCTVDISSELGRLEPVLSTPAPRMINVQWSLEKMCSSPLDGFNLTYCRLGYSTPPSSPSSPSSSSLINHQLEFSLNQSISESEGAANVCEGKRAITVTLSSLVKRYDIMNLEPFSIYKIEMYMFNKKKKGQISHQFAQTKEGEPSPPRNLTAYNVTSNSVIVTWSPPAFRNGLLRKYILHYNDNEEYTIDCMSEDSLMCTDDILSFKLLNLKSFTNYRIFVTAFTLLPSVSSNVVQVRTLIGVPSKPRHIQAVERNQTYLRWQAPEVPAGRIEYYEVAIKAWNRDSLQRERITAVIGSNECLFQLPICVYTENRYTVQVRAVNVAKRSHEIDYNLLAIANTGDEGKKFRNSQINDDLKCIGTSGSDVLQMELMDLYESEDFEQYKSVWEHGPTYNCSVTKVARITIIALLIGVCLLSVLIAFYVMRKKYIKMANISCELPAGLESNAAAAAASTSGGGVNSRTPLQRRNSSKARGSQYSKYNRRKVDEERDDEDESSGDDDDRSIPNYIKSSKESITGSNENRRLLSACSSGRETAYSITPENVIGCNGCMEPLYRNSPYTHLQPHSHHHQQQQQLHQFQQQNQRPRLQSSGYIGSDLSTEFLEALNKMALTPATSLDNEAAIMDAQFPNPPDDNYTIMKIAKRNAEAPGGSSSSSGCFRPLKPLSDISFYVPNKPSFLSRSNHFLDRSASYSVNSIGGGVGVGGGGVGGGVGGGGHLSSSMLRNGYVKPSPLSIGNWQTTNGYVRAETLQQQQPFLGSSSTMPLQTHNNGYTPIEALTGNQLNPYQPQHNRYTTTTTTTTTTSAVAATAAAAAAAAAASTAPSTDTTPLVRCMSMGNFLYPSNDEENYRLCQDPVNRGEEAGQSGGERMGAENTPKHHLPGYVTYRKLSTFSDQATIKRRPTLRF